MQSRKLFETLRKGVKKGLIMPFLVLIWIYRYGISPFTPPSCRFTPTCSAYCAEALRKHGLFKGCFLSVRRLLKCHPWGESGYDPVPEPHNTTPSENL